MSMSVCACTYRGKFMYGDVLAPKIICQPLLDKSSKLLDQKFVSLVKNSEKCNSMLEIISEANALK